MGRSRSRSSSTASSRSSKSSRTRPRNNNNNNNANNSRRRSPESRSRSRSPRSRSRSRSHSRSRSRTPEGTRVHVANLGLDPSKREIKKAFDGFGTILEVWLAHSPPCFAFVVFKHKQDAKQAIKHMDGQVLNGQRIRASLALPRSRGRKGGAFDPRRRCYQCGQRGHFSRRCLSAR